MVAGAAVIGTNSVLVRIAGVAPTSAAFWRMLFGGLMLMALLKLWGKPLGWSWRATKWLLLPAAAFAADLWLWHRGIEGVGPGLATLLANLQVFLMAAAGVILFGERLSWRYGLGLALAFAGIWLLVGRDWSHLDGAYRWGLLFGALTGLAYAAYMLSLRDAQRRLPAIGAEQVLCLFSLICAVMLLVTAGVERTSLALPHLRAVVALLGLGLAGQVIGWVLMARAIPHLPASLTGLLLLAQPLVSFVLDVLLFSRPTAWLDWLGLGISLSGIFLASARASVPRPEKGEEPQ